MRSGIEPVKAEIWIIFHQENEKLDRWTEDLCDSFRSKLDSINEQMNELSKKIKSAQNLPDTLVLKKRLKELDKKKDHEWKNYDKQKDKVRKESQVLIETVKRQMEKTVQEEVLFTIKWRLV